MVRNGGVAQLGEHLPCKQGVRGSNPLISTPEEHPEMYLENIIQKEIINSHLLLTRHLIKESKR